MQVMLPYLRAKAGQLYKLHAGQGVLGLALRSGALQAGRGGTDQQVGAHALLFASSLCLPAHPVTNPIICQTPESLGCPIS